MATIVNTTRGTAADDAGASSAGWAVAVIILLAVIVGAILWYNRYSVAPAAPTPASGSTIQVNLPSSGTTDTGTSGTGAGSASQTTLPNSAQGGSVQTSATQTSGPTPSAAQ